MEVLIVRFDYHKACCRPADVWIVGFDFRKACRRLVEVRRVRFDNKNMYTHLEKVWKVSFEFDFCRGFGEVRTDNPNFFLEFPNFFVEVRKFRFVEVLCALWKSKRTLQTSTGRLHDLRNSNRTKGVTGM